MPLATRTEDRAGCLEPELENGTTQKMVRKRAAPLPKDCISLLHSPLFTLQNCPLTLECCLKRLEVLHLWDGHDEPLEAVMRSTV